MIRLKNSMVLRILTVLGGVWLGLAAVGCGSGGKSEVGRIPNPSFEESGEDGPLGWRSFDWRGTAEFRHADEGHTGLRSLMIESTAGGSGVWEAAVMVRPFARYRFKGWIKTENLEAGDTPGVLFRVADVSGVETEALSGTRTWTPLEMEFDTEGIDAVRIQCLFGGRGGASGAAWFDDLELELLESREIDPSVIIAGDRVRPPVSPLIFGQFIEHLGRCIYGGIWAEMLEDRKFYFAPGSSESPWRVIGGEGCLRMAEDAPLSGDHEPEIVSPGGDNPAGLSQAGLGLTAGKSYNGRIVLRGRPEAAPIEVSLIWGEGPGARGTVTIDSLNEAFTTELLEFTVGADTDEGRLEIITRGTGTWRVGAVSLQPGDNVQGFRADTLELLRRLNAPVYRWPGGNFVSGYDWHDGLGDPDRRPTRKNPAWSGIEPNDVGIHEFIALCRLLETEPYVTVNTGLGSVEQTAEEVEYCNGAADTAMGRLRARNGSPEPFGVKWWAVGNEMYGSWQLGYMPLEDYVLKHNRVAAAMRAVDPDIKLVAVGSVGIWSETMLRHSADAMDLLSEHFYTQEGPGLMTHIFWPLRHIRRIAEAHREYRRSIPGLAEKDIRIALDEWNFWYGPHVYGELGTRYYLKDALGIAAGLHEFFRNSDIYAMANYAQTVNVIGAIKTSKTAASFAATGLALELYRREFGSIPIELDGAPEPLDVAAAWTGDRSALTVAIVNPTLKTIDLPVSYQGIGPLGGGRRFLLTGPDPMAYNEPGKPPAVTVREEAAEPGGNLEAPALAAVLYVFPVGD